MRPLAEAMAMAQWLAEYSGISLDEILEIFSPVAVGGD